VKEPLHTPEPTDEQAHDKLGYYEEEKPYSETNEPNYSEDIEE
jgi:hypothetical protein